MKDWVLGIRLPDTRFRLTLHEQEENQMNVTATAFEPKSHTSPLLSGRRNGHRHPLTRTTVRPTVEVAQTTGPLDVITDGSLIVIADAQNLDQGAKELGFKLSWANLGTVLDGASHKASRHAIIGKRPGDDRRWDYLTRRGWRPHATEVRQVQTHKGWERKGNVDFLMAFLAGVIVSRSPADVVVIASGDGDLVEEMAFGIRSLHKDRRIVTLSLAGSTAFRLNARTSKLIDANIEIGLDCLRPTRSRTKKRFRPSPLPHFRGFDTAKPTQPKDRKETPHVVPSVAS